jgi:hypothetical protein
LSPKIKKAIVEGYVPKHLSVQDITNCRFSPVWSEQEAWFGRCNIAPLRKIYFSYFAFS